MSPRPAISVRNVAKRFEPTGGFGALLRVGDRRPPVDVLTDVSFEVGEGEVFGLLGPNGAGKTTLVEILATLVSPTGGVASIHGHDVVGQAAAVRTLIGLVPADSETLYPRLTGRENLRFFGLLHGLSARATEARVDELLGLVGLTDDGATRVERYSDGMKARLSLARGLVADPRVLLLDEPTRALDPIAKRTVRRFVVDELAARRRKTVVWVTHSLAEAEEVCGRLAILHQGRLATVGTPAELARRVQASDLATAFARSIGTAP